MTAHANPILQAILAAEFERGLALHAAMDARDPEHDRWAGYCLFGLGQHLEAKDLLLRAVGGGCRAASIELATVLRTLGQPQRGLAALEGLNGVSLSPLDAALAQRERGALLLALGRAAEAAEALEGAWALAAHAEAAVTRVPVAQLLGFALSLCGFDREAVHYLSAAVQEARGVKRRDPMISRALALAYTGAYAEAERDLTEAQELPTTPILTYTWAKLRHIQGRWDEATELYRQAAQEADERAERGTGYYAQLALAALDTALGRQGEAEARLQRIAHLAGDDRKRGLLHLREGALRSAQGRPGAETELVQAAETFQTLEAWRELGWTALHRAEDALRRQRPAEAEAALEEALHLRQRLGAGTPIVFELRALPRVREFLQSQAAGGNVRTLLDDWRTLRGGAATEVQLVTLGRPRLLADGQPVRLALRRAPEVVAYLAAHPGVTREHLVTALWPDDDPRRAVGYLHQVRHEVERAVPGLRLPFDKASGTYALSHAGVTFRWDAEDIKRLLSEEDENAMWRALELYGGPFLPEAGEWARAEREALEWSVIRTGLKLMHRWSAEGEHAKCLTLARRLLEIEPASEALAECLVEATLELEGVVAAKRTLRALGTQATDLLGELPPGLADLQRRLETLH